MNQPSDEQKELLVRFIEQNVFFFDIYFNWIVLLSVLVILFLVYWFFKKIRSWVVRIPILLILSSFLIFVGFFALLINGPLKPFIESVATINRSINSMPLNFQFKDVRTGHNVRLSEFNSKVILLNFWGTYCGPCIEEMPDLKRLEKEYSSNLVVIALSDESDEKIQKFLSKHEAPSIVGSFSKEAWITLGTFRPLTIYIDKSGTVREYFFGKSDYDGFKSVAMKYF